MKRSEQSAEIAVIVVNYGTAELAIDAVESVLAKTHGGRSVEVHLVDNASPGSDRESLRAAASERGWAGRVELWLEDKNHGFARGNNVVLKALAARDRAPEKVFLLNPDARIEGETIAALAAFLDAHPKAATAGAAICKPDGTRVTAAFRFPSIPGELVRTANIGPVTRLLSRWRVPMSPELSTQKVDWVAGAAVMFRFEAIREAGFFDPAYFLYFEEIDLMQALRRGGWETWYVAETSAVHEEGAATGVSTDDGRKRRPAYVYEAWRHYYLKNHGRAYALAAALVGLAGGTVNLVVSALRGQTAWLPRNYAGDVTRLVLVPLLRGQSSHTDRAGRVSGESP